MDGFDTAQLVALAAVLGFASGIRLYAVLLVVGLVGFAGWVDLPAGLAVLSHPWVLAAVRERDARLPALDAGQAWRVYALAADGVKNFRRLARVLESIARDARVELRVSARESRAPVALRAAFPLRIELLFDADEGYVPLVPLRELDLTGD
jgi:hypothetical protein